MDYLDKLIVRYLTGEDHNTSNANSMMLTTSSSENFNKTNFSNANISQMSEHIDM